jgi:hypothetical protein
MKSSPFAFIVMNVRQSKNGTDAVRTLEQIESLKV